MNYNQSRAKYLKKKFENPLPKLNQNERIYLNVTYRSRDFAKYCHCGFDDEKKLWFTGCLNAHLESLVQLYGVHSATSDVAINLMNEQLKKEK